MKTLFPLLLLAPILLMAAGVQIASGLDERLAKWRRVKMPFDASGLTANERKMVLKLVEACQQLEQIYWRQSDPEALELYRTTPNAKLKRFLMINGSRWDLIDEEKPFVGNDPAPPGANLYPKGLTREQIERYVSEHPAKRKDIYHPYTIVDKRGQALSTVAYHEAYKQWLEPAARALRGAASLTPDDKFARFLRLRADALSSDDYYPSDLAWVDLQDPKVDIIFAPYETYLDRLLGVKGSYGAAVLIRNEAESRKLAVYQKYVPQIQDALPLPAEDRPSKHGHLTPMEVCDSPFRAGDLRHGYQAVADNLPNDPRIHREKGTKKIFFKNFMDARVNYVVLPLAKRLMPAGQAAKASGEGYLAGVLLHEISHELGPAYSRQGGKQVDIREAIGGVYGALEEAKADAVGMFGLKWLVDQGALPKDRLEEFYASYVAGVFRTVRYGAAEAHGHAEMMEFNFLAEQGAVAREASGRYRIDYGRMPAAFARLAEELLEVEATGDRGRAERWFARYDKMPAELAAALKSASDVPVDVDPEFSFAELPGR